MRASTSHPVSMWIYPHRPGRGTLGDTVVPGLRPRGENHHGPPEARRRMVLPPTAAEVVEAQTLQFLSHHRGQGP